MSYKIMIDAGHGGADPGAVFGGRQEKDDNLRLALAVGDILSRHGIDVVYTRTDDIYQSPIEKARLANASGADYFISFHRNSSPEPNQYSGVETLVYDQTGQKVTMAQNINSALEKSDLKISGSNPGPALSSFAVHGCPHCSLKPDSLIRYRTINSSMKNLTKLPRVLPAPFSIP